MDDIDIVNIYNKLKTISNNIKNNDTKRDKYNQSGGSGIFVLLNPIFSVFTGVARGVVAVTIGLVPTLFTPPNISREVINEDGSVETHKALPYYTKDQAGLGLLWKYLWWCLKTTLYIIIFAFGGIGITIVAIFYMYMKLFTKFGQINNRTATDSNDVGKPLSS